MKRISADLMLTPTGELVAGHQLTFDDRGTIHYFGPIKEQIDEHFSGTVSPGFINTHCHLELSHLENKKKKKNGLHGFISDFLHARKNDPSPDPDAIKNADHQMWENGIMAVADICNTADSFAVKQVSKIVYHCFIELFDIRKAATHEAYTNGLRLYENALTSQLAASLTPHAPYSVSDKLFSSIAVADIEMDDNGDFWILAGDGLTHFDGTTWTVFDTSNSSLPSNAIYGIGTDQNNLLWVHGNLTQNSAFIYTYDGSTWTAFDTTICQPLNAFSFIESDGLNKIWIGTYGKGLQMINGLNCSVYTDANSPLPTNYILDIHITNSQTLWIATQLSGLIKVDLPVGVAESPYDEVVGIHPNPASDKITITDFPGGVVRICNVLGEVVLSAAGISNFNRYL